MLDCKIGSYTAQLIQDYEPKLRYVEEKKVWAINPTESSTVKLPMSLLNTIQHVSKSLNCSLDSAINTCALFGSDELEFPKMNENDTKVSIGIDRTDNIDNKIIEIGLRLGVSIGTPVRKQIRINEREEKLLGIPKCKSYVRLVGNCIVEDFK